MAVTRVNGGAAPIGAAGQTLVTGRSLAMYTVGLTGVHTGYGAVDSDFEKLVRAIETVASVELLGTPASNEFRVAISGPALTASGNGVTLEGICNAAVAGTTVTAFTS